MKARSLAWMLAVLASGCSESESRTPPATSAASQVAPPVSPSVAVSSWLDRAAAAPHNGTNPELELPEPLLREGADWFQQAIAREPEARRRDAASALARHPEPDTQRAFWLTQLRAADPVVRLYATTSIASIHHPDDLEPFIRACFAAGDTLTLAVRVRDWSDRRAVPLLVGLLAGGDLASQNAATSLSMLPGVPALEPAQVDPAATAEHLPNGAWRDPETTLVAPYTAWWAREGRLAFETECVWWRTISPTAEVCAPLAPPAP
ncbi:MAG: hypothetical protein J0L92_31835 [Deltaproteobacteria bacterium]|nr:hypothetical protein [Deltaproteobacteria bacterium]